MLLSRRQLLASSAALVMAPSFSVSWAKAETSSPSPLVVIFLRGGMDALNLFGPVDDPNYIAARPHALRVTASGDNAGIDIGGAYGQDFRLNAEAPGLAELYRKKELALIHAVGLTNATRSHFQAMDMIERGVAAEAAGTDMSGWLTRTAHGLSLDRPGSTFAVSGAMPQSFSLCESALQATTVDDLAWSPGDAFHEALAGLHRGDSPLDRSAKAALSASGRLAKGLDRNAEQRPSLAALPNGVSYPDHDFGRNLRFLAEILRIDPEIGVATVDFDGFDTHEGQAWKFRELARALSAGLLGFRNHLDAIGRRATIVVMSEFGRRFVANRSQGTDHGHGGLMMVLGDHVAGGQCYGTWPGLAVEQLDQGADLAVTTDYRDVLAAVLAGRGQGELAGSIFAGHAAKSVVGLMLG